MASVMTSGSGPSSRIEPARTNGVPVLTSVYISPLVMSPASTAAAIEPCPRTTLIALRWCWWPPAAGVPSDSETPSDVPNMRRLDVVHRDRVATEQHADVAQLDQSGDVLPGPVWTTAGPTTAMTSLPASRVSRIMRAISATTWAFGFSEETALAMNSNDWLSRGRSCGCTRMPLCPTT